MIFVISILMFVHMGWLRLVGSLKLQVSFAEYRLFYRFLVRSLLVTKVLVAATPYTKYEECVFACVCAHARVEIHSSRKTGSQPIYMNIYVCVCVYVRVCVCVCVCV